MVKREIRDKVKTFVKELKKQKIRISKVILYGSQVSGKTHRYSDIDLAIVSPDFGKNRFKEGIKLLEIACQIDPLIEPIPLSLKSYKEDTWIPLVYEIRSKGIVLTNL